MLGIERNPGDKKYVLRWVLTPGRQRDVMVVELREKIKSKMDAAKFLASFVTATLGVQLALLSDVKKIEALDGVGAPIFGISTILLVVSAILFFATILAYDKLLMPSSLWADRRPKSPSKRPRWLVWRPPSSDAWLLLQNMQRVWKRMFILAAVLVPVALLMQAGVILLSMYDVQTAVLAALVTLPVVLIFMQWLQEQAWPRLGSED